MKLSLALSLLLPSLSAGFVSLPHKKSHAFFPPLQMGIMDEVNSDSFDLLKPSDRDKSAAQAEDAVYEQFLAELVFSTNDPRVDIVNNMDRCADDDWLAWLDKKVEASRDPDERVAMRDLYEMIIDIKDKMELSKLQQEREERERMEAEAARLHDAENQADQGRKMTNAEVLKKATAINTATAGVGESEKKEKKSFYDQELTPEIRMSYEKMLKKVSMCYFLFMRIPPCLCPS
jgi:hypothetical protein